MQIIGKRTILFPFEATELSHFVELHRADKAGMMGKFCLREMTQEEGEAYITALIVSGQIKIWSCYTKEGKASRKFAYIYLSDISPFSANLAGIIDKETLRGLAKVIRKGKYSFSEDSLRTITSWAFNGAGFNRLEYRVFADNRLSINLAEKSGFEREGCLRRAFKAGEDYKDVLIYSVLKDLNKIPDEGKDIPTGDK